MRRHIHAAHQENAPVLEEASELMAQRSQADTKQQLLRAFNKHFVLSENDITTLTSAAEPINDHFFAVLARTKKIEADCEVLLGSENQRLGLEIVENVTKNLNSAFQKLFRWVQREFKQLNLENPQISSSIRKALRVLAERPSLFQNCLDAFAEARENSLSDSFYTALTGSTLTGEVDSSIKPIELVAHDPLRYVGDMLAWIHSTTVSEREALEVLFISDGDEIAKGIQAGRASEPWMQDSEAPASEFDGLKELNNLVDRDVTGVARVLRQRVEQVIQSHEETILAYKIANLLNFYRVTFAKLLGQDSALLDILVNLEESAMRQFRVLMRDHVAGLQAELQHKPTNLDTPDFLQEGLKQLTAIMKTFSTSFASASTSEDEFQTILEEALDPFLAGTEEVAEKLDQPGKDIFKINCLLAVHTTLSPFEFVSKRAANIQAKIEQDAEVLIDAQYQFFLNESGLKPLLDAVATLSDSQEDISSLPSLPALQPQALTKASQQLDDFLPSALMDAMDNLKQLQSSKLARNITERAADQFCEDFELVEGKLAASDESSESMEEIGSDMERVGLRALFPRTSGEIRVLLS
jgi:hypothetical protein